MQKIIVISGTTASGKTACSIELAKKYNGIIINADSMQIYKGLPILSAQPNKNELDSAEHLLFSYLEPNINCNVGMWLKLVKDSIEYSFNKNKTPIIVGGTGMYISKLINGISPIPEVDEATRNKINKLYNEIGYEKFYNIAKSIDNKTTSKLNPNDQQRLKRILEVYEITKKPISYFQNQPNIKLYNDNMFFHININLPREILYERCLLRFKKMIEQENVIEEIKAFQSKYNNIVNNPTKYSITKTIGLMDGIDYINNKINLEEFIEKSVKLTRNYAKRQYTWFNHQFTHFDYIINSISNNIKINI